MIGELFDFFANLCELSDDLGFIRRMFRPKPHIKSSPVILRLPYASRFLLGSTSEVAVARRPTVTSETKAGL
jgi:hypothetical protein